MKAPISKNKKTWYMIILSILIYLIIRIELREMKAIMNRLEIKITEPILDKIEFWQCDYYVRGYHAFSRYWDAALKIYGEKLSNIYFSGLTK